MASDGNWIIGGSTELRDILIKNSEIDERRTTRESLAKKRTSRGRPKQNSGRNIVRYCITWVIIMAGMAVV